MTPTPPPDPARCPECGCGWWEPHRTGCSEPRFPAPSAPGEGTERPGGAADCVRRSHWIGSKVGKAGPGYGHDGGFSKTPCVPYHVAADCDPIALCTITPPTPQPPVPLSPAPQADGWTAAELLDDLNDRTERAMVELERTAAHGSGEWHHRTLGKLAGLALVADWLRGYDCGDETDLDRWHLADRGEPTP